MTSDQNVVEKPPQKERKLCACPRNARQQIELSSDGKVVHCWALILSSLDPSPDSKSKIGVLAKGMCVHLYEVRRGCPLS